MWWGWGGGGAQFSCPCCKRCSSEPQEASSEGKTDSSRKSSASLGPWQMGGRSLVKKINKPWILSQHW